MTYAAGTPPLATLVLGLPLAVRVPLAVAVIAPLALLMGMPFPTGIGALQARRPGLVPWAWGVNGFASVLAAPAATAIAMTWGYTAAGTVALALYVVPGVLLYRLPGGDPRSVSPV